MSGKYALIIGNTEYIDSGLAQLSAPGKDAEDFARVLKDKEICAFDDVKVLLNHLSSSVIEAIDEFFDQKKPDDLLVLYFSGHGVRDEYGSLYLAFTNTIRTRLRSTAIKDDYIRGAMDQSRSKRQVVILDCCNSGAFPQGTKAEVGGVMGLTQAFQGYGRFVLTASDSTQFAWEGDKVIGETDNSLFTHFLVEGLEGEADNDGDGKITVDDLYDYAFEEISKVTAKQTPTKSASRVEGDIILRQITRLEDIKPVSLSDELIEATEDSRTFVREGAVQQLEKLLKGKNLGLARSAREVLERMEREDDSRRVTQAVSQVLESIRQAEKEAEGERRVREEAERLAALKAEERLAREKAETERKAKEEAERLLAEQMAKEEAERLATLKVEEELLAREKAEAERRAIQAAEQKAEEERKAKEEADMIARTNAKREAAERTAREKTEAERLQKSEEERIAKTRVEIGKLTPSPRSTSVLWITLGWVISGVILGNFYGVIWWVVAGAIGGLAIAINFRIEQLLSTWKSMLWIILGWTIGWTIGWVISNPSSGIIIETMTLYVFRGAISGALMGGIGGLINAITLWNERVLSNKISILLITIVWATGWTIGEAILWGISWTQIHGTSTPNWSILGTIEYATVGAIGSFVMIWEIREGKKK